MSMQARYGLMLAGAGLLASGVDAGTVTPVQAPPAGEKTHAEILGDLFGGVFVQNGDDFSNGTVEVTRVDDDNDQTYDFLSWEAHAMASYAAAMQSFGTVGDGALFDAFGSEDQVGGQILGVPGGTDITFARFGSEFDTKTATTDPSQNADGLDHVVTYTWSVNGEPVSDHYLLFFEDLLEDAEEADFDYNDFVVEVVGQPIPEPSALALIAMGGLAMLRRRR